MIGKLEKFTNFMFCSLLALRNGFGVYCSNLVRQLSQKRQEVLDSRKFMTVNLKSANCMTRILHQVNAPTCVFHRGEIKGLFEVEGRGLGLWAARPRKLSGCSPEASSDIFQHGCIGAA